MNGTGDLLIQKNVGGPKAWTLALEFLVTSYYLRYLIRYTKTALELATFLYKFCKTAVLYCIENIYFLKLISIFHQTVDEI